MKKLFLIILVALGSLTMANRSNAQLSVSINIGSQPAWGPTGYDYVQYYYLPDINAYYNVSTAQFIYLRKGRWMFAKRLPRQYANFNIYNSYKVVVNRTNPYLNNAADIRTYGQYKGRGNQAMIRDAQDQKYYVNKGNRYHDQWAQQQSGGQRRPQQNNGNGRGR